MSISEPSKSGPRKACILAIMIFLVSTVSPAFGADVLFVVGGNDIKASDQTIKKHLQDRGFDVAVKTDKLVKSKDADGKDLIILSESARSKEVLPYQ